MIGGTDIVFPTVGGSATLEAFARIVRRYWPEIRFEDAVTGDKYRNFRDIPFGSTRELLAYPDAESEAAWDADSPTSAENSMLYLILRAEDVTLVVDNPNTPQMQSMIGTIRYFIRTNFALDVPRAA